MIYTTDLSFVTGKQASKHTFGLIESFDTKYLRTENFDSFWGPQKWAQTSMTKEESCNFNF